MAAEPSCNYQIVAHSVPMYFFPTRSSRRCLFLRLSVTMKPRRYPDSIRERYVTFECQILTHCRLPGQQRSMFFETRSKVKQKGISPASRLSHIFFRSAVPTELLAPNRRLCARASRQIVDQNALKTLITCQIAVLNATSFTFRSKFPSYVILATCLPVKFPS